MQGGPPPTAPQAGAPLRWRDLVPVLVFTILGIILVFAVIVGLVRADRSFYRANLETIALSGTLAIYLAVGAGLAVALRRLPAPLAFLGLRWPTLRDLGLTAALVVPWYIGIAVVTALSSAALNGGHIVPGNTRQLFIQHPHGLGILVLALLVTAVAAPLCEEAFFRGMLFRLLRRRFPLWAAVLLSATAFGLAHASPTVSFALLPVFVYMGVLLAVVYAWTGSLTNTILLHSLNNTVGTVTVFFLLSR
jgi:membrane protease YdiL (CAAX protease family)